MPVAMITVAAPSTRTELSSLESLTMVVVLNRPASLPGVQDIKSWSKLLLMSLRISLQAPVSVILSRRGMIAVVPGV